MSVIDGLLNIFIRHDGCGSKSEYIFYKIVSFNKKNNKYLLQCFNTKATFFSSLNEIVSDKDILYGLHPVQACYIGIEFSKHLINYPMTYENNRCTPRFNCRYGTLSLRYQDRDKNLCFIDKKTQKEFVMNPYDIALSEELINEFDAIQAFYVGILSGYKINTVDAIYKRKDKKTKLTLIRN